jgi:hypothetical protein
MVPLGLMTAALLVITAHVLAPSGGTVHALRIVMGLFIVAGVAGMILHYQGNLEFQLEMDPTQSSWTLLTKVLRAKSPPPLAPGLMAQLGLLGLLYTYRHPALSGPRDPG